MNEKGWQILFRLYSCRDEYIEMRRTDVINDLLRGLYIRSNKPSIGYKRKYQITNKGIKAVERRIDYIRHEIDKLNNWLVIAEVPRHESDNVIGEIMD